MSPDHYTVLGLRRGATAEQIRVAYRLLAKQHHPDVNGGSPESLRLTQLLNSAYEVLADPERRRAYDQELAAGSEASGPERPARKVSGNIAQDVLLDFRELIQGTALVVRVKDPANLGVEESYDLTVPPETAPGTRFRIARESAVGRGFVSVRVRVRPDGRFKARGSDLRCDLRVSNDRATRGGVEFVRGVDGRGIRVEIPAGVPCREVIRIRNEGLPKARGGRGDLLVRIVYRAEVRISRR
jgi:curved DNA-binding protein